MKCILTVLFIACCIQFSIAQNGSQSPLLSDITDGKFRSKDIADIQPMPDGEFYTMLSKDKTKILKYSFKDGKVVDTLFDVNTVRETKLESIEGYLISSNGFRIVVWTDQEYIYRHSWKANLYDYDVRRNFLKPLSDSPGKLMNPLFSPDGRMCSYVRDNNIWLKKFDYDTESQVTKDGAAGKILNGFSDWVYEEEFAITNLMSWSSDSKFLSFVRFDETNVPIFSFQVFDGTSYPGLQTFKYPKAGENNSVVGCYTYSVETKDIKKMNIPMDEDGYIPLIKYTQNPDQLAVITLNRQQNIFNMYYVNPKSAVSRLILREESKYYIDSELFKYITFTPDNFVYLGEKDGYVHAYLYSSTGVLQKQLTSGTWDVTDFYGIDPVTKSVYFQSSEESPMKRAVCKIDEKGALVKLSARSGTNSAVFSTDFKYYVNWFTDLSTPSQITINDQKGKTVLVLEDNNTLTSELQKYHFSKKEFFTFVNPAGVTLNGWMIKPTDFSESKKYPVLMAQYSGPNSQQVLDQFGLGWEDYMATQGYIVVCVDGRGTGARGEEFRKCTYQNLCTLEAEDQVAAARYLAGQSYVDKNKIAIWGWSYGGTMTLMCLSKGDGIFKAGISVAPVTDWKLYDSVYTERYMRTPKENFTGYEKSSPIHWVNDLKGKLLIVHGTADDNVHYQNTLYYTDALVNAGKQFDMQIYSNKNHSLPGKKTRLHLYTRLTQFLAENL